MSLLNAINETIRYATYFGGNLDLEQLCFRLLSNKRYQVKEIENEVLKNEIKLRRSKHKENSKKIKIAKALLVDHLSKFEDILMVGITGSVAAENAKNDEDIDLCLICKSNRLWLTRLKLRLYIKLNHIPHRRYGQLEHPNDFCFNLWFEENNLTVPKLKQNQKNAVDLIMMKVILNKNDVYTKFISNNRWAEKYVANGYNQLRIKNYHSRRGVSVLRTMNGKSSIIDTLINYVAFLGQLAYIRLKGPVKFISLTQAFFHK